MTSSLCEAMVGSWDIYVFNNYKKPNQRKSLEASATLNIDRTFVYRYNTSTGPRQLFYMATADQFSGKWNTRRINTIRYLVLHPHTFQLPILGRVFGAIPWPFDKLRVNQLVEPAVRMGDALSGGLEWRYVSNEGEWSKVIFRSSAWPFEDRFTQWVRAKALLK